MYAEPFVCDYDGTVAVGNTPQTYNLISFPSGNASIRKNVLTDTGLLPEWMKISHQVVGKGEAVRDRHLIRFEQSSTDADDNVGTTLPCVAYIVMDVPRKNCLATTPLALVRQLVGFLRNANADDTAPDYTSAGCNWLKFLNSEM